MNIKKYWKQVLLLAILGLSLTAFLLSQRSNQTYKRVSSAAVPMREAASVMPYPEESSSMDSPDGTMTLIMKKKPLDKGANYVFLSSSEDSSNYTILNTNLENGKNLSIPYNTWSPDNKYIFLKEITPSGNNYYVHLAVPNTSSAIFPSSNIQEMFTKKVPEYEITDVTGWASPIYILVNAVSKSDQNQVSFWYDVENQSFTQLSLFFN